MERKIAIYTRVSILDQTTLNQRIRLEKYAELQGWQVEIFEEIEQSVISEERANLTCEIHEHL